MDTETVRILSGGRANGISMVSLQYPWDLENVSNIRVTNLQSRGVLDIIPITDFRKYKTLRQLNSSVDFKI